MSEGHPDSRDPMSTPRACPTCKKPVAPRSENPGFPFCSMRCRQVDLGRWLGEEFRLPSQESAEQAAEDSPGGTDRGRDDDDHAH